ncbi:MAG: glycerophosphodiester phosphodiesterase, partial [Actinomycetota bacterium]|nr:glycerophosphodiester phosphodiesterase [Actinomycetota bacterium]
LVRAIRRQDALERVCIASFSSTRLRRARALLGPEVCSAAGPREISALVAGSRVPARVPRRSSVPAFQCLQVPVRHAGVEVVTPALLRRAGALGCQVHVWTIDEAHEMHRLLDLGVDGIMTDKPSVLRSVLESRGEWNAAAD